ncbi:MAG: aminotransferase class III-fold pyridoxal phosphate-dependent enzyme [Planctomycetes bacterium]|nr:aminotransferase class III-fold pyridoxal phosphate-dependent enzyme [Planctomycetota bacterium]
MASELPLGPQTGDDLGGATRLVHELYGLHGQASFLPSDRDWNFALQCENERWVLKIAHAKEDRGSLDFEHTILERLSGALDEAVPEVRDGLSGDNLFEVRCAEERRWARLFRWLPGKTLAGQPVGSKTWSSWGKIIARADRALADLDHPHANRAMHWDLAQSAWVFDELQRLPAGDKRVASERITSQWFGDVWPRLAQLPRQVLHHDANEFNLIAKAGQDGAEVTGIFDLGDAVCTARVFEVAIASAYAMYLAQDSEEVFDIEAAFAAMTELVHSYHKEYPLKEEEFLCLFPSACQRMVISALTAQIRLRSKSDHEYASVHQHRAWTALESLANISPTKVEARLREACNLDPHGSAEGTMQGWKRVDVVAARNAHTGPMLSLSYRDPLEIVRGRGTTLIDKEGRAYLDCVNNVSHVGHCHPKVVKAATEQMARLNTNTRYLSDLFSEYSSRLASLFSDPLEVVFLVNSGSEANELALRLAYAATGRRGVITTTAGYHGNTQALVDVSAYKHDGKGGTGAPDWVAKVDNPDPYRGPFSSDNPETAVAYATQLQEADAALRSRGFAAAAFLIEALPGCGGQNVPPQGYLARAFDNARALGAVTIADEVQIGFGRVGSHWWAYEEQGARPDIVTLGKPIGNGHPIGAVVTTRKIAEAFHTGMEWFNTFGGNPVSCATGIAVLNVIEEEGLRDRARRVGEQIRIGLQALAKEHAVIGDVRGRGMYLGAEFVIDRDSREPDADRLKKVIEFARSQRVLLSSDGPDSNVLKIKPPIVFDEYDAQRMLTVISHSLKATSS